MQVIKNNDARVAQENTCQSDTVLLACCQVASVLATQPGKVLVQAEISLRGALLDQEGCD